MEQQGSKDPIIAEPPNTTASAMPRSTTDAQPPAEIYNEKGEQIFTKKYLLEKIAFEKAEKSLKKTNKAKPKTTANNQCTPTSSKLNEEVKVLESPQRKKRIVEWDGRPMEVRYGGAMTEKQRQSALKARNSSHQETLITSAREEDSTSAAPQSQFYKLYTESQAVAVSAEEEISRLKEELKTEKSLRMGAEGANRILREQLKKEKNWHKFAEVIAEKQQDEVVKLCKRVIKLEQQLDNAEETEDLESAADEEEMEEADDIESAEGEEDMEADNLESARDEENTDLDMEV